MTDSGERPAELPAYPGMGEFVGALDKLVRQPRRQRRWLPVVLLLGAGAAGSVRRDRAAARPHHPCL
ncbi:hypothetical protein [Streptomyces sp. URMC 129]|uniref:hypothetical protein n=1 Tax=Streptomyces sp. URMC 129 TaxID=3423407 RepID=UPI003F1D0697